MDLFSSHPQIFPRTVQYHPCWSPSLLVSPGWCHSSLPPSSLSSPSPPLLSIVSSPSLLLTTVFMCLTHSSPSIPQVSSLLTLPQAFICFSLPFQPSISIWPSASFPLVSAKAQFNDIHIYDTVNCVSGHQWQQGVPIHMPTANLIWTIFLFSRYFHYHYMCCMIADLRNQSWIFLLGNNAFSWTLSLLASVTCHRMYVIWSLTSGEPCWFSS